MVTFLTLVLACIIALFIGSIAGILIGHNNGKTVGALIAKVQAYEAKPLATAASVLTTVKADIAKVPAEDDLKAFFDKLVADLKAKALAAATTPPTA